jgi:hypothetical protein
MEKNYVDDMSPKQKMGWKVLISIVRKKFPFIKDITIPVPLDTYGSFLVPNIIFDLEDLWKFYNVTPPIIYNEKPFLYELFTRQHSYLMSYVDDQYSDKFGYKYNNQLEQYLFDAYRSLPKDMKYLQYEKWEGQYGIESIVKLAQRTVEFRIQDFVPIFDVTKYYKKREGDLI